MNNICKNEGEFINSNELKVLWSELLMEFDYSFKHGNNVGPIKFLIKYIIEKCYDRYYFPGSSLFSLLISIPINQKIDFTHTLKVEIDEFKQIVKFNYHIKKREEGTINYLWQETCQFSEICDTFEYFIHCFEYWNPNKLKV